ncbi:MAG: cbb3-type cytochrome c oxidase N-terminal domain-containing protein [Candidatus Eisenbacteria bacterium]
MTAPRDEDRLLEHEYDGIREYDNPLPRWWVLILWVSIVYSVVYLVNIIPGVGSGPGRAQNYENEMAVALEKFGDPKAAALDNQVEDATVLAASQDPARVTAGQQTFVTYCASCHREDAGGNIGPNLTDDFWIHGAKPSQIHNTIANGVLDKGMPAWSAVLKPDQVLSVSGYVLTVHDSHPKDPKEPQGTKAESEGAGDSQ